MQNLSCCGTDCGSCGCYGNLCEGCNERKGKVFHAPEGKACPIYECSINKNAYKNCGQCKEIPCGVWRSTRDPKYSDEEFNKSIENRMKALMELEKGEENG
ncbi:MAG: DUF3795 domain-containing protein [Lachnospiraceae bacterium]|nr:DUF3795 domain-containing protein [Lachnospiraceae bacterium]